MTPESVYLAVVLITALVLFYTSWLRTDLTALLVMLALMAPWRRGDAGLEAILPVERALSGFGSPAVIMVAAMFILSAAMTHTGGARLVGARILAIGARSERSLQLTVLVVITLVSAFINDTTTVLIWMPMVLSVCREKGYAPSRVLLPLAYASLLGGQWTLIGTRSNILVSDYLRSRTGSDLGFFDFTPTAAVIFLAALAYMLLVGRRLLPQGAPEQSLAERYEVAEYLTEVMVVPSSSLVGQSLADLDLAARHGVRVLEVLRKDENLPPSPWLRLHTSDVLVVQGRVSKITDFIGRGGVQVKDELKVGERTLRSVDLRIVEAIVSPNSAFVGKSLEALDFSEEYGGVSVLALGRHGLPLEGRPLSHPLRYGDTLLMVGHETEIERLRRCPNVLLLDSRPLPPVGKAKAYLSISLMVFVALATATKTLEPGFAIPLAAVLAVLTRCIGLRQAYESLELQALVVVGAMIPFGYALEDTHTAERIGHWVSASLQGYGPHVIFAALLLLAVLLTQIIENAAVAIILAPIGYELAVSSGANPATFLLGIAICVSTAFTSPIAHESTLLVMVPGRYRFADYMRVGTPLALLAWLITVLVLPLFVPL